jgi:hypothetical protein
MAELTAVPTANDLTPCTDLAGMRLRRYPVTCNAATSSTWTSGIQGIQKVAWKGTTTGDGALVTAVIATGVITIVTASGSETGELFVWSES